MNKKRLLSNIMVMSMLAGMSDYSLNSERHLPTRCKSREEIAGYEHKGKSQSKLEYKKSLEQNRKLRKHKGHKHGGARKWLKV